MKLLCRLLGHKWEEVIVMMPAPPGRGGGMVSTYAVVECHRCGTKKNDKKVHWPNGVRPY